MKIGFLFPGQGSQSVGMGKDFYEKYPEYRAMYDKVKNLTNMDVAHLTFESSEEELGQTKNTQICILTMSLAILEILKNNNIKADIAMGLSLGEYTALIYAGVIKQEDGIKIVQKRGEIMQKMCPKGNWAMAAIIGLEAEVLEQICRQVKCGFVTPANYNCIGQIAISGEKEAVEEVCKISKEKGAKKAIMLKTSGPFHTRMLEEASKSLKKELEGIKVDNLEVEVIKNIDGKPYKNSDDIREILANHIISPVKFADSIQEMINQGVDTFIEIGPGKTLSSFVKRTKSDAKIYSINSAEALENLKNEIEGE